MKLAVIGDVHANAEALEAALRATEQSGFDLRILIGDLLTYGVEVTRTLDLVSDALKRSDTILILGNHDEIYSRLIDGQSDVFSYHADWVAGAIEWTLPYLPTRDWANLPFRASFAVESIYFSHANPFGAGNWSYLNNRGAQFTAVEALRAMNMTCGVFGHTHRACRFTAEGDQGKGDYRPFDFEASWLAPGSTQILNAGSAGQPRSCHPREVVLWIEVSRDGILHQFESLNYDLAAHLESLRRSSLPEAVKSRCLSFFRDVSRTS